MALCPQRVKWRSMPITQACCQQIIPPPDALGLLLLRWLTGPIWTTTLLPAGKPPDCWPGALVPAESCFASPALLLGQPVGPNCLGADCCRPCPGHPDSRRQTFSQAHDPRDAGRGAVKGCSTRCPSVSHAGNRSAGCSRRAAVLGQDKPGCIPP